MDKNNKKDKVKTKLTKEKRFNIFVFVVVLVMFVVCIGGCCSCVNEPTKQERNMKRAFEKKERGEDLTPKEQETIDNYYEWKYKRDSNKQD